MAPLLDESLNGTRDTSHPSAEYVIPDTFLGTRRPIKVIVIGFGFSGIQLSYTLGKQIKDSNITLQFYEKNPELGGTWFENSYPGCGCDIPTVNYQFSWYMKPDWTSYYSKAAETLQYLKDAVAHHGLDANVKYNHRLTEARWDSDKGKWVIRIRPNNDPSAEFVDSAEILITATGILNNLKWPDLNGLDKFKNKTHTAAWDHTLKLQDKIVGVVGNGSSSMQAVPAILQEANHVVNFIRGPSWVISGIGAQYAAEEGANVKYSEEQKQSFKENPEKYIEYRKAVEIATNPPFDFVLKDTPAQLAFYEFATSEMKRKLGHKPELVNALIPTTFAPGCRRPNPGFGYLEAIASDRCTVTLSKITEVTEEGIVTEDGILHKLDVLVCGTGFDVSYRPAFPFKGINGVDLRDVFKDVPDSYLTIMTPGFPNCFTMLGPFAPIAHGSILPAIEVIAKNIAMTIEKFQTQNIKSFVPKQEAVDDFREHRKLYMKKTIFDGECSSWWKLGPQKDTILMWPGSRLQFFDIMLQPRWEDFDWEYLMGNRFSYWGNGFTPADAHGDDNDKTWFIGGV